MADCYKALDNYEKAIETIKLGIDLLSEKQAYMTDWAYYHLTIFYYVVGDLDGMLGSGVLLLNMVDIVGSNNALPHYLAWYLEALLELKQYQTALQVSHCSTVRCYEYSLLSLIRSWKE